MPKVSGGITGSALGLGRFGIVSAASFLYIIGLTALLHEVAGLAPEAAYAVSLVTVLLLNFLALRYWVFPAGGPAGNPFRQLALTAMFSGVFRLLEYLGFVLVHTILGVHYLMAMIGVMAISFVCKYVVYGRLVFSRARRIST